MLEYVSYHHPSPTPFTVAIDMDGVLYDFVKSTRYQLHIALENIGDPRVNDLTMPIKDYTFWRDDWGVPNDEFGEFMKERWTNTFGMLGTNYTIDGAIDGYRKLADDGFRIELITRPWAADIPAAITGKMRWISHMLDPHPHSVNFVMPHEHKHQFAFDVIVEDEIKTAVNVANNARFVVVLDQPWNHPDDPGWDKLMWPDYVLRAQDWHDVGELVSACYDRKSVLEAEWGTRVG